LREFTWIPPEGKTLAATLCSTPPQVNPFCLVAQPPPAARPLECGGLTPLSRLLPHTNPQLHPHRNAAQRYQTSAVGAA
jgi:hypothetical protein